jgi:hypothetical protein
MNYLPGLVLNHDSPDLCLLSSWDYRREPLCPVVTSSCHFTAEQPSWVLYLAGPSLCLSFSV